MTIHQAAPAITPECEPADCAPRSLWGWSPPPLPADTRLKRLVDRWLPRTGLGFGLYFAAIVALLALAFNLDRRPELLLDGVVALAAGGWCALNFWRCRHAHCVVSAGGFAALALLTFVEAGLGRTLIHGFEASLFPAVVVVAVAFEGGWYLSRGTNAC